MPKIGNEKPYADRKCDRCGSKRKITKTWTERVENSFSKGQFTQSLTLTRMVGQDVRDDGEAGETIISEVVDDINPNDPESYVP